MVSSFKNNKALAGIFILLFMGGIAVSFQDTPIVNQILNERKVQQDTLPGSKTGPSMTMKEFDALMQQLDVSMVGLSASIASMNMDLLQQSAIAALQTIDVEKMIKDAEASIKNIDMEKIMLEARLAMKKINWKEVDREIKTAMKAAEKEMQKAAMEIKAIDKEKIKREIENAHKELLRSSVELKKANLEKVMALANLDMDKARAELQTTKEMFNELEKDGLVNSKNGFTLQYKDRQLWINGQLQPSHVAEKYRKFIKGDSFEIRIVKE